MCHTFAQDRDNPCSLDEPPLVIRLGSIATTKGLLLHGNAQNPLPWPGDFCGPRDGPGAYTTCRRFDQSHCLKNNKGQEQGKNAFNDSSFCRICHQIRCKCNAGSSLGGKHSRGSYTASEGGAHHGQVRFCHRGRRKGNVGSSFGGKHSRGSYSSSEGGARHGQVRAAYHQRYRQCESEGLGVGQPE